MNFKKDIKQFLLEAMTREEKLLNTISKLRNAIRPMIGHPENPFDEDYLQEIVDLADEHIDTTVTYFAVFSPEDRDYLIYGYNLTDSEKAKEDLLSNQRCLSDEYIDKLSKMTLEEAVKDLGYELETDTQSF